MSGGFLRRWSERKTATREAEAARPEPGTPADDDLVQAAAATDPELPHKDATRAAGPEASGIDSDSEQPAFELSQPEHDERLTALPSLDDIGPETDIRPFLQDFVPAALRKAAMRRAWSADPIISTHLDVARDYAWEFNSGDLPVGFSRSLGPQSVQRSLDALGKIGEEPLKKVFPVKDETEGDPSPMDRARPEDAVPSVGEPQADTESAASPGADLAAPSASPSTAQSEGVTAVAEPPTVAAPAGPESGLVLRPRHGTALPD